MSRSRDGEGASNGMAFIMAGRGDKSRQPPRARLGIPAASDTLRAI